ncbi:hypothetical protein IEO21_02800 [Rhodonia placenta]|uniref:Uncharacterized protein n=1 Tax=Rhodonia placenta TaxID=104341 RepID=A0A8H7P709_9APHY|nr:hypothetical protein IEO21_02800 [Postia placenta]
MTTCALDLSDLIDFSQIPTHPDSHPDLHAHSLPAQVALRPLPIWRALRGQNENLATAGGVDDRRKPTAAPFSAWSDPTKIFFSDVQGPPQFRSPFDILSEPVSNGHVVSSSDQCSHENSLGDHDDNNTFVDMASRQITTDTSPSDVDTQVVSSVAAPDLHEADQETTSTKYVNYDHDTSVEDEADKDNLDGQNTTQTADEGEASCDSNNIVGKVPSSAGLSPAAPPSDRSAHQPHLSSQTLHHVTQTTDHQVEATGLYAEHSLWRSTRKRKRIEPAPHMVPVVSNHSMRPPKRARATTATATASKGKARATAAPEPAPRLVPQKTADGRYACPHCPSRRFQRYHDCLRHIDTSKRCLGWNGIMYPCHRCGSKYTRRDAVKRHMDDKPNCT